MKFRDYIFENISNSFHKHLLNEDYMRFLKKNPHLTPDQREKINKFYTGKGSQHAVKEFEKNIGWQSKRVREMTWSDFAKVMKSSKAGQRELLQSTEIPGSKGKDYWPIKLKTKDYIANIPLNFKTAKFMNSCDYGTINVNYCIGSDDFGDRYWEDHVLYKQKVPIYITDGKGKWVVMIKPGNKDYEVWDKFNKEDLALSNREPIPNFSIKKELLSGGLNKLYDKLRHHGENKLHWIAKAKTKNAKYEIASDGKVYWHSGTWIDGEWRDGVWEKGTWKKGMWIRGTWKNGTWENGTWINGIWLGGTWLGGYDKIVKYHPKGDSPDKWMYDWIKKAKTKNAVYEIIDSVVVWKNGTWISGTWDDGIWKKGTWKYGVWLGGTWEYGIWEKGSFEGGTWKDGIWKRGDWYGDTWEKGTWEDGYWEDGTWESGTWEGGEWVGGTWLGGYDKHGNYHPAGDSPDKWNK